MRIKFIFLKSGDTGPSDIRITFVYEGGSESCLGRRSEEIAANMGTMKINMNSSIVKIQADVLHEFGHALGLIHEHQHPECKLKFDRLELMRKYSENFIDQNYGRDRFIGTTATPYDVQSIMHYPVQWGDTIDRATYIPLSTVLSDGDRKILMSLYPIDSERKRKSMSSEPMIPVAKRFKLTYIKYLRLPPGFILLSIHY
ncbi:hypothetical protein GGR54DRAFT_650970 [Hypoxylon sp. NC1633]|nr:hypothetical protein GGR54DRAFT_650970 [Hypoxylon sp. NC1633]